MAGALLESHSQLVAEQGLGSKSLSPSCHLAPAQSAWSVHTAVTLIYILEANVPVPVAGVGAWEVVLYVQ